MKAVVAAFNQEKALVGAFSVITNLRMQLFEALLEVDHSSTSVRGPPCFIPSGDKVMVEVQWTNPGVARLTQSIKYITPFLLELPWIGVETEVCDFLDDGKGCQDNAQVRIKIMKIFFLVI